MRGRPRPFKPLASLHLKLRPAPLPPALIQNKAHAWTTAEPHNVGGRREVGTADRGEKGREEMSVSASGPTRPKPLFFPPHLCAPAPTPRPLSPLRFINIGAASLAPLHLNCARNAPLPLLKTKANESKGRYRHSTHATKTGAQGTLPAPSPVLGRGRACAALPSPHCPPHPPCADGEKRCTPIPFLRTLLPPLTRPRRATGASACPARVRR